MFSACPSVCACRAYVRACVLSVQRQSPTALPSTSSFRQALVWFCTYSPAVELAKRQSTNKPVHDLLSDVGWYPASQTHPSVTMNQLPSALQSADW